VVYEMADLRAHTDVFFPMYARIPTLERYAAERRDRPLILSEYAHAMGNSVGNLGDYWDVIRAHEQLQGGFLWDWVDQAFPVVRDGRTYWGYGDDFGGRTGGGNFSVNGLVAPDRSLHPHAWEVRKVYQPVAFRATDLGRGRIEVDNLHDFVDLGSFSLRWRVTTAAGTEAEGTVADVDVPPHGSAIFDLPIPPAEPAERYERFLDVELVTRRAVDLLPEGHVVAWEQFRLGAPGPRMGADVHKVAKIRVTEGGGRLVLRGEATDFTLEIDLARGEISSFTYLGRELVSSGPRPDFWRPPTDNDYGNGMPERQAVWHEASSHQPVARVEHWQNSDRDVEVVVTRDLPAVGSLHVTRLHVLGNGEILVTSSLQTGRIGLPDLPRVGMTLILADSLRRVEWFGRGPHESYADRKRSAKVARWSAQVDDMAHPYIRPQETGNLTDVRWIALSGPDGVGLLAVADSTMSASALPNPDADYDAGPDKELRHAWDVRPRGPVYLDLDLAQMGVGGDTSWGARVHPEYTLPPGPYAYRVRLVPFGPGGRPLEAVARELW
jgi:beta-galactosidase